MNEFSLRNEIERVLEEYYADDNGSLWHDEGVPYAIASYHSSVGSVLNFTADDWAVCAEYDLTVENVCSICDESYYQCDTVWSFLEKYVECNLNVEEIPNKIDVLNAIEDYYTWIQHGEAYANEAQDKHVF